MVTDGSLGVFDQSMVYNCNILDKGAKFPKIELCCIVDDVKYFLPLYRVPKAEICCIIHFSFPLKKG